MKNRRRTLFAISSPSQCGVFLHCHPPEEKKLVGLKKTTTGRIVHISSSKPELALYSADLTVVVVVVLWLYTHTHTHLTLALAEQYSTHCLLHNAFIFC